MRKTYIPLTLVFLALLVVSILGDITIEKSVLFWTFSTIVQAFVGLLALLGMLGIFRLQSLDGALSQISEINRHLVFHFRGALANTYVQEELIAELTKIGDETSPGSASESARVKEVVRKLKEIMEKRKIIRGNVLSFTARTISVILFSLVSLPIADILSDGYLGLPFLATAVILSIYSLISTVWLMKAVL